MCGGGSGGHLYPALAVLEELQQRSLSPNRVTILHPGKAIDEQILTGVDCYDGAVDAIPLPAVDSGGLKHRPVSTLRTVWDTVRQIRRVLRSLQPNCVIGTGGGGSLAGVLAACRERIPTLLLEQNVIPGRATSLLSRWTDAVCLSFDEAVNALPRSAPTVVTGNPVRHSIAQLAASSLMTQRRTLLILGGSQGATAVNRAMCILAQRHPAMFSGWQVMHQTGQGDAERVHGVWHAAGIPARVEPFFGDLHSLYRETAVAVSRSGATSLAEFSCAGIPAVLVPYPNSIRDHQHCNARWYAAREAAVIIEQSDSPEHLATSLATALKRLLGDDSHRESMQRAMRALAWPDAAARVADVLERLMAMGPAA